MQATAEFTGRSWRVTFPSGHVIPYVFARNDKDAVENAKDTPEYRGDGIEMSVAGS